MLIPLTLSSFILSLETMIFRVFCQGQYLQDQKGRYEVLFLYNARNMKKLMYYSLEVKDGTCAISAVDSINGSFFWDYLMSIFFVI